jgi:hypothetical protein
MVFVKFLNDRVKSEDLKAILSQYGELVYFDEPDCWEAEVQRTGGTWYGWILGRDHSQETPISESLVLYPLYDSSLVFVSEVN